MLPSTTVMQILEELVHRDNQLVEQNVQYGVIMPLKKKGGSDDIIKECNQTYRKEDQSKTWRAE